MIGYRIPTEDKRSMLPLVVKGFLSQSNGSAIMLPADITLIAGSDFDVDKMYLRIPAMDTDLYRKSNGRKIRKLQYDFSDIEELDKKGNLQEITSPGRMGKEQRDNLMIDIEYAVLTSTEGTEQIYNPGNFDTIKRNADILEIQSSPALLEKFMTQYAGLEFSASTIDIYVDSFLALVHKKSPDGTPAITDKALRDFLSNNKKELNSLYPQTYVYLHHQNMTGKSLVGVYANGASVHCKTQQTGLRLDNANSFIFNGRTISSLHDQRRTEIKDGKAVPMELIQHNIAEFQAASVDNAKDPVLAKLFQSMYTAGITLTMLRLGFSIEEVALTFGIVSKGLPKNSDALFESVGGDVTEKIKMDSRTLVKASVYASKYPELYAVVLASDPRDKDGVSKVEVRAFQFDHLSKKEYTDFITTVFRVTNFYGHIRNIHRHLKPINDSMKADSPNNAIATGLPAALLQRRRIDNLQKQLGRSDSPFVGTSPNKKELADELIRNDVTFYSSTRTQMKRAFMAKELAIPQAFYTLGIELPTYIMAPYLIQGIPELWQLASSLMDCSSNGEMTERQINAFYREFMSFILSGTYTFGDEKTDKSDENVNSFDTKREHYLYYFPKLENVIKKAKSIKELRENKTVARLISVGDMYPTINLPRSGKMTPDMKAAIRNDLSSLLYSDNPEVVAFAKDLFMYSFFHDGFNFRGESIGTFFDATFWDAFPEIIEMLRTFREKTLSPAVFDRFLEMYIANNAKDCCVHSYRSDTEPKYNEDGSVLLRKGNCVTGFTNFQPSTFIKLPNPTNAKESRIYRIDWSSVPTDADKNTIIRYVPLPLFDEPDKVYNINSTAADMAEAYYNNRVALVDQKKQALNAERKDALSKKMAIQKGSVQETQDSGSEDDPPSMETLAANNGHFSGNVSQDSTDFSGSVKAKLSALQNSNNPIEDAEIPAGNLQETLNRMQADDPIANFSVPQDVIDAVDAVEHPAEEADGIDDAIAHHLKKIAGQLQQQDSAAEADALDKDIDDIIKNNKLC